MFSENTKEDIEFLSSVESKAIKITKKYFAFIYKRHTSDNIVFLNKILIKKSRAVKKKINFKLSFNSSQSFQVFLLSKQKPFSKIKDSYQTKEYLRPMEAI